MSHVNPVDKGQLRHVDDALAPGSTMEDYLDAGYTLEQFRHVDDYQAASAHEAEEESESDSES